MPEFGVFALDLGRAKLDLVQLFGGVDTCEDVFDFPVFEIADIEETWEGLAGHA